jgi:hypothetical protein
VPSHCRIECCGDIIFDSVISKDIELMHEVLDMDHFYIEIIKTGKTLELVKKNQEQVITIENINLNGIDLKTQEFGEFRIRDNPYVDPETLQTDRLHLNGVWCLELPKRSLVGTFDPDRINLRDEVGGCDIACFGCSQTFGSFLEYDESWPAQLQKITGKSVKNYGVSGSNINEITSFVDHYVKNYKTDTILLYLPHTFRRQMNVDGAIKQIATDDAQNKELVLHGEEHSIAVLSGNMYEWLENISRHTKIYFGTYQTDEHELYERTSLKKFMFPFLQGDDYPKASDNLHHGAEFNQDLAKIFKEFLKLG